MNRSAPTCRARNSWQRSGSGNSRETRVENSSRITGNSEVIHMGVSHVIEKLITALEIDFSPDTLKSSHAYLERRRLHQRKTLPP